MPVTPTAPPVYGLADFMIRTVMPAADVTVVERSAPGKVAALIAQWQAWTYARLRKRYAVPFAAPVPEVVLKWITDLVTPDVYRARGVIGSQDAQIAKLDDRADQARAEIKEAADSVEGLFDLPLLDTGGASAITLAGPLGYSEASPYAWQELQSMAVRGTGTDGVTGDVSNPYGTPSSGGCGSPPCAGPIVDDVVDP